MSHPVAYYDPEYMTRLSHLSRTGVTVSPGLKYMPPTVSDEVLNFALITPNVLRNKDLALLIYSYRFHSVFVSIKPHPPACNTLKLITDVISAS
jgi:hypothetical protein